MQDSFGAAECCGLREGESLQEGLRLRKGAQARPLGCSVAVASLVTRLSLWTTPLGDHPETPGNGSRTGEPSATMEILHMALVWRMYLEDDIMAVGGMERSQDRKNP